MLRPKDKPYYGWWVLSAVSGINFANAATSIGVLTVFLIPMTEEFGWSRTQISAATSLGAALGAVAAPFAGRLSDRLGARVLLSAAGVLIVVATLYLSVLGTLVGFYAAFGLARLADQGLVQSVSPPAVAKWFLRHRGRALAILFLATSAGGVVLPPLAQLVISVYSWRVAWAVLAAVMLFVGLIPTALLVRRQPEDMGLRIDGATAGSPLGGGHDGPDTIGETGWRMAQALATPAIWLLLASAFLVGVASTGIALHIVPYLVEQGLTAEVAVGAVSLSFLAGAIGNLCWGLLAERVPSRYLLTVIYGVRALSIVLLLTVDSAAHAYGYAILHGFTEAGAAIVGAIILADYFGRRHLGSIYGLSRGVRVAGFALGPLVSGAVYDVDQSYGVAFLAFIFVTVLAALLAAAASRPFVREIASV